MLSIGIDANLLKLTDFAGAKASSLSLMLEFKRFPTRTAITGHWADPIIRPKDGQRKSLWHKELRLFSRKNRSV